MVDTEAKKILGNLWADDGLREDPEDHGLDRSTGWPEAYEQVGSGFEPELPVFQQLKRELDGFASDRITMGIPGYDADVNYVQPAFAVGSNGKLYVSLVANGPAHGNTTAPVDDTAGAIWRMY